MKIKKRNDIQLPTIIIDEIETVIFNSLNNITTINDEFIINDTDWYAKKRKGGISPCVVNEAGFISKKFQSNLASIQNWSGETKVDGQNIDGFGKLIYEHHTYISYKLKEDKFLEFLKKYLYINNFPEYLISKYFAIFYAMYEKREIFTLDCIPEVLHEYFIPYATKNDKCIRIGVEFETGNTSSAYRAFFKLNSLFAKNIIDVGIFITSKNKKDCAARIWPQSNRNGSFEELQKRNYRDNILLPMLEFEFEPDSFSKNAPYLKENGTLYIPYDTKTTEEYNNEKYQVFIGSNNDKIMKRI